MNVLLPSGARRRAFAARVLATLAAVGLAASAAGAQQAGSGRVVGRIVDAATGAGLTDVGVQVVGTTIGTMSGVDGRYVLQNVPAGTVTLQARRIGYQAKTVTGLFLRPDGALEQNIALSSSAVQLTATVVTAEAERGTVNEALDQQRNAAGIITAITREQIARSPDSDAAQAVQRVSGVTVQDGRYVFVRGLGERYTQTSLNGARLPSPEPERKVVPLDLFPSGLLQTITTSKTFTPDQSGDFSGAQVDIRTREFPASRQIAYSMTVGMNDAATGTALPAAPRAGLEWLGFGGEERDLPGYLASFGNFRQANPDQSAYNRMVHDFRNAWSPTTRNGTPNGSLSLSVGGNDPLFGRELGYVASFNYSYGQEARLAERRSYARPIDGGGETEVDRFDGVTARNSVLWGGLLNLSTMLGTRSRLSWNNTYSRTSENEARTERGVSEQLGRLQIDRLRFVARSVLSSQLAGEHQLDDRNRLDWSVTGSGVSRLEPDRSEFVRALPDGQPSFWLDAQEAAVRTYSELKEYGVTTSADYTRTFGASERPHSVKFGGQFRYTDRDATSDAYSVQALGLSVDERAPTAEAIFDGRYAQDDSARFRVQPLGQGGSYTARDLLGAGYVMLEYQLSDRIELVGGARVEYSNVDVAAASTDGTRYSATPTYTDVLPSAALNLRLTDDQNLRFSASQTLARPEYRELAGVRYRDVIGGESVQGNPDLERTLIQNADVRWEWYPNAGELVSAAVFAKRFQDPIERVFVPLTGTRVVNFVNAEEAYNYGIELELRKSLGFVAAPLAPFTAFANATFMESDITLGDNEVYAREERPMVGQAPYVYNVGLTFAPGAGDASATVLFNEVGKRVVTGGSSALPPVYEQPRGVLDLSLRFPVWGSLAGRFDAKNLLDADYQLTQGAVTRESYRAGRVYQLGLQWRP